VRVFESQFNNPKRTVQGILIANISKVQETCISHTQDPRNIFAYEEPTSADDSHAVLKPYTTNEPPELKQMSKSLSGKVLEICEYEYFVADVEGEE